MLKISRESEINLINVLIDNDVISAGDLVKIKVDEWDMEIYCKKTYAFKDEARIAASAIAAVGAVKLVRRVVDVGREVDPLQFRFKYLFCS